MGISPGDDLPSQNRAPLTVKLIPNMILFESIRVHLRPISVCKTVQYPCL